MEAGRKILFLRLKKTIQKDFSNQLKGGINVNNIPTTFSDSTIRFLKENHMSKELTFGSDHTAENGTALIDSQSNGTTTMGEVISKLGRT